MYRTRVKPWETASKLAVNFFNYTCFLVAAQAKTNRQSEARFAGSLCYILVAKIVESR